MNAQSRATVSGYVGPEFIGDMEIQHVTHFTVDIENRLMTIISQGRPPLIVTLGGVDAGIVIETSSDLDVTIQPI